MKLRPSGSATIYGSIDQLLSGMSNVAFVLGVALVSSPMEFGAVSVSLIAATGLLTVSRASLGNQIAIAAAAGATTIRHVAERTSALVIATSPFITIVVATTGFVFGRGTATTAVAWLALAAPIVLFQDQLRFEASALAKSHLALLSDMVWVAITGLGYIGLQFGFVRLSPAGVVALWLAGALLAAVCLIVTLRHRPIMRGLMSWARTSHVYLMHSVGGSIASATANIARASLVGAWLGPAAVGALSAGQMLMTPLNLLAALIPFALTPRIAAAVSKNRILPAYGLVGAIMAIIASLWGIACSMVSETTGVLVLGPSWTEATPLIFPMTLLSIGVLLTTCALSVTLIDGRTRLFARASVLAAIASIVVALLLLLAGADVRILAWGQAVLVVSVSAILWIVLIATRTAKQPESRVL